MAAVAGQAAARTQILLVAAALVFLAQEVALLALQPERQALTGVLPEQLETTLRPFSPIWAGAAAQETAAAGYTVVARLLVAAAAAVQEQERQPPQGTMQAALAVKIERHFAMQQRGTLAMASLVVLETLALQAAAVQVVFPVPQPQELAAMAVFPAAVRAVAARPLLAVQLVPVALAVLVS